MEVLDIFLNIIQLLNIASEVSLANITHSVPLPPHVEHLCLQPQLNCSIGQFCYLLNSIVWYIILFSSPSPEKNSRRLHLCDTAIEHLRLDCLGSLQLFEPITHVLETQTNLLFTNIFFLFFFCILLLKNSAMSLLLLIIPCYFWTLSTDTKSLIYNKDIKSLNFSCSRHVVVAMRTRQTFWIMSLSQNRWTLQNMFDLFQSNFISLQL